MRAGWRGGRTAILIALFVSSAAASAASWDDRFGVLNQGWTQVAITESASGKIYIGGAVSTFARWDGRVWTKLSDNQMTNGVGGTVWALVAVGENVFVGGDFTHAGGRRVNYLARFDGNQWFPLSMGASIGLNGTVRALAIHKNSIYAGGDFTQAGSVNANNIARWDGTNWHALGIGVRGGVKAIAVAADGTVFIGGTFTNAGGSAIRGVARWDGNSWMPLASGISGTVNALATRGNELYAGGAFTSADGLSANRVAKWNGTNWSSLGPGLNEEVYALSLFGTDLYAGGEFTTAGGSNALRVARWNGSAWRPLAEGVPAGSFGNSPNARAFLVSDGKLLVAGNIGQAGRVAVNNVAAWDGGQWSALHRGTLYDVYSVAVNGTNVYTGGDFTTAFGIAANRVARWDGFNAYPLGLGPSNGVNGTVRALAVEPGGIVYAGGSFARAGGITANGVARWDGTNWSALGSGVNGTVWSLARLETNLYVGGDFTSAGGVSATNIARWDGQQWHALPAGFLPHGLVLALAVIGRDLYVGGVLYETNSNPNSIWRWDGKRWWPLRNGIRLPGPGGDLRVNTLAVDGTDLYVGGNFRDPGGVPASNIARWDGQQWFGLGIGIDRDVQAITVHSGQVYAGGLFTMADGKVVNYIAKWDGSEWESLGQGVGGGNQYMYALANRSSNVYVGGRFEIAGGKSSYSFGIWNSSNAAPAVVLRRPAPSAEFIIGSAVVIEADADDEDGTIAQVAFHAGTNLLGTATARPYAFTWTNAFPGDYVLVAKARDNRGALTTSEGVFIRVTPHPTNTLALVEITTPTNSSVYSRNEPVLIRADALDSDGGIREVLFYEGDNLIGSVADPPYQTMWSNSVAGFHTLRAIAIDDGGARGTSAPVQVRLQYPPEVFIRVPSEGDRFEGPQESLRLMADARDFEGGIQQVEFFTNGVFLGTGRLLTSPDYEFVWTIPPFGTYAITAKAFDDVGGITTSRAVNITIETSNAPPVVTIISPTNGAVIFAPTNVQIRAEASDPDGTVREVQFYASVTYIGRATNEPYVLDWRNLSTGVHYLEAVAIDNRGKSNRSPRVSITVMNDPERTPKYILTDLATLGGLECRPFGINNKGQIVGTSEASNRNTHPFLYENGRMTNLTLRNSRVRGAFAISDSGDIAGTTAQTPFAAEVHAMILRGTNVIDAGTLGGPSSIGRAINSSGKLVGSSETPARLNRPFLFTNGVMRDLGTFGGLEGEARGINDWDHIVGWAQRSNVFEAFLHTPTNGMRGLGSLGGPGSQAFGINDFGQIVGQASYNSQGQQHAFLYMNGTMVDLGTLGAYYSKATAINDLGQVVGTSDNIYSTPRAFLWQNCVMYDLNHLVTNSNWELREATAINDRGQIVGIGRKDFQQEDRGFLLTPAPDSPVPPGYYPLTFENGQFHACVPVAAGAGYVIEASDDLETWRVISTNVVVTGMLNFTDHSAGEHPHRFYRMRSSPSP